MNNTKQRVRLVCCQLGLACIASLAASCTDRMAGTLDDRGGGSVNTAPTDVDPTGAWDVSYTFSASCSRPPLVQSSTLSVTQGPDGYTVDAAGATTAGALTCAPDGCELAGTFTWSVATTQFQQTVNIALDATDHLTGTGTELVVNAAGMCSYSFAVDGMRTPGSTEPR